MGNGRCYSLSSSCLGHPGVDDGRSAKTSVSNSGLRACQPGGQCWRNACRKNVANCPMWLDQTDTGCTAPGRRGFPAGFQVVEEIGGGRMGHGRLVAGGARTAVAAPLLIIQMSPEVGAAAAHALTPAQSEPTAAVRADGPLRRVRGSGEGLAAVGVVGDLHWVRRLLNGRC